MKLKHTLYIHFLEMGGFEPVRFYSHQNRFFQFGNEKCHVIATI
ncbi:hypothetical protein [Sphingobacterium chuzhouense]